MSFIRYTIWLEAATAAAAAGPKIEFAKNFDEAKKIVEGHSGGSYRRATIEKSYDGRYDGHEVIAEYWATKTGGWVRRF